MRIQHDYNTHFDVIDDHLVRTSLDRNTGQILRNRCNLHNFESVAHAMMEDDVQNGGTHFEPIAKGHNLRHTQVAVALDSLKERSIVAVQGKRTYLLATKETFVDAMMEFHALAEAHRTQSEH